MIYGFGFDKKKHQPYDWCLSQKNNKTKKLFFDVGLVSKYQLPIESIY